VETFAKPLEAVRNAHFSTAWSHRRNRSGEPFGSVFPVVHTPYDFYERI
jgi:hypothetical protein